VVITSSRLRWQIACVTAAILVLADQRCLGDDRDAALPAGVAAVWDIEAAQRESTATRERVCINGLWRWQPAEKDAVAPPVGNWGFFKVPGCWPGITDYLQKDCQTLFAHPAWKDVPLASVKTAWYQREIIVPDAWSGRRVSLAIECLNSQATVFLDGKLVGDVRFPGGELEVTQSCRPGQKQVLSLRVAALPLKAVLLSYNDTNQAREVQGTVPRRGLCGDVYLVSTPASARIADVKIDTSVRRREITFETALADLSDDATYTLRSQISADGQEVARFTSPAFSTRDLHDGRIAFTQAWQAEHVWDLHTPGNMYVATVSLLSDDGHLLDEWYKVRFGFREFWIDGRDFYLNGSRIFLSAVPFDNAQVSAASASYSAARESLQRLKSFGINFVYTHNYGCEPGTHLSFAEILRAADDVGMLVAFSQPHFAQYDWQAADADTKNGYARHAEAYVRMAQNHPAVVAYAMSHNATGYGEDMNPDMIDGMTDPRSPGEMNNVRRALRAEAIVKRFDPARIVYHHSSGNLGSMHTVNFYPNFVPVQEMSDWFEHWATVGVKPVFLCEYGAPFAWDWAMYRGWYHGERSFGSARVPWDFSLAEWNAQFYGDRAYNISEYEKHNLRWEAKQFREGKLWHRWDYPHDLNSKLFEERDPISASYITENWRAFRTWGVSAISPWEHAQYWKLRDGVDRGRKELAVDWNNLQRTGFSADYLAARYERMDLAYERSDWLPTAAAQALIRNNLPLLAYLAGKPAAFTSKDHIFLAGETVEKQLIVINNSRQAVTCDCTWSLALPTPASGTRQVAVPIGEQVRVPLSFELPDTLEPGTYQLSAAFRFSTGETQEDAFVIHVRPRPPAISARATIALFDPAGATAAWLKQSGVKYVPVEENADLSKYHVLIVGKGALTVDRPAPDVSRVAHGLRVLMFEQTPEVLSARFGFRVAEYGLRWVFPRVPDHPLLASLPPEQLRDWRGSATIVPPRLKYELRPRYGPTVRWCDIPVTRLWRCGNRGNVASVLIEKPARGDFMPIVDGGYSLQYSPLIEFHDGQGMILFCQMDLTGRSEAEPAADALARNVLHYVCDWKPAAQRSAVYIGEPAGKQHLESAGITVADYDGRELADDQVLIVGPGGGDRLAADSAPLAAWLKAGGHLLAIGLDEKEIRELLPSKIQTKRAEHIAAYFDAPGRESPLAGVGPADNHNRDPKELPLVSAGAMIAGDGVLALMTDANLVLCQMVPWQYAGNNQPNLKKTYRRSSYLVTRLLANMGIAGSTPIVERFHSPVDSGAGEKRWRDGLYLDQPEEWDDPYRFFRW
jgi:beta-galactosidase